MHGIRISNPRRLVKGNDEFRVVIHESFPCSTCLTPGRIQRRLLTKIGSGICDFPVSADQQLRELCLVDELYTHLQQSLRTRSAHGALSMICKGCVVACVSHEENACEGSILSPYLV